MSWVRNLRLKISRQNSLDEVDKYRHILLEKIADVDEKMMDSVVHNKKISAADIKQAIRRAVVHNKFVPVLCGSAFKNKGIQPLLDAICDYLAFAFGFTACKGY